MHAVAAFGAVLNALANSTTGVGGRGTIHMKSSYAVLLDDKLYEDGGKLRTRVGDHLVVVGDYPSNSIVGHHGEPVVYIGDIELVEFVDRSQNEYIAQGTRDVLVVYNDCTAVRAGVSGTGEPSGGGGGGGDGDGPTVYVWDGDSYEVTENTRIFIGPEDPDDEGFDMGDGDLWQPTSEGS